MTDMEQPLVKRIMKILDGAPKPMTTKMIAKEFPEYSTSYIRNILATMKGCGAIEGVYVGGQTKSIGYRKKKVNDGNQNGNQG